MRNLLKISSVNLCLIATLLWAQVVVAQHGLEHDFAYFGHEVSEVCEAYANADNAKATLIIHASVPSAGLDLDVSALAGIYLNSIDSNAYAARAPPQIT